MVAKQQFSLCAASQNHQNPAVNHKVHLGTQKGDKLQRFFNNHAIRNIQDETILGKQSIECPDSRLLHIGQLAVELCNQFRMLCGGLLETAGNHTLGQQILGSRIGTCKSIVGQEIELGTQVRYAALEGLRKVNGHIQTCQVHTPVGLKPLGHIGMQILLKAVMGQTVLLKALESLITQSVHYTGRSTVDQCPVIFEKLYVVLR